MYIRYNFFVLDNLQGALYWADQGRIEKSWLIDEMKKTDHIVDEFEDLFKYHKWFRDDAFIKMQKTLILMALERMSRWDDKKSLLKLKTLIRCHYSFVKVGGDGIGKEYAMAPLRELILKALKVIMSNPNDRFQYAWVLEKCINSYDYRISDMSRKWFLETLKMMTHWNDEKLVEKLEYLVFRFQKLDFTIRQQSQKLVLKINPKKLIEKFNYLVKLQKYPDDNIRKISRALILKCLEEMSGYDDKGLIEKFNLIMKCYRKSEENDIRHTSKKLILKLIDKELDKFIIKIKI